MIDEYFATDLPSTHALTSFSFSSNVKISRTDSGEVSVELPRKHSVLLVGKGWRCYSIDPKALYERIAESRTQGLHWPSELMIVTDVVMADSTSLIWTESPGASLRLRAKGGALDTVPLDQMDANWEVVSRSGRVGCELGLRDRTPLFRVGQIKQAGPGGQVTLEAYR